MTRRRRLLRGSGVGIATGLAGCVGFLGGGSDDGSDGDGGDGTTGPDGGDGDSGDEGDGSDGEETSTPEGVVVDGAWSSHRGDAANTAQAPTATPPRAEPTPAWSVGIGGYALLPTLHDGTVYVGNANGDLYAVDAESGETEWETGTGFSNVSVAATDGALFVSPTTQGAGLAAVDPADGEESWSTDDELDAPPVAVDDGVVFPSDGRLVRLDAATGEDRTELFATEGEFVGLSHPAVADGTAHLVAGDGRLLAVDLGDGTVAWEADLASEDAAAPTVADGTVYVPDRDAVTAVDAASGEREWRNAEPTSLVGPAFTAAVDDDTVCVATDPGVAALDRGSGTVAWAVETRSVVIGPVVADGTVYLGEQAGSSSGGGMRALAADDGTERWTWAPLSGNGAAVFEPAPSGNALFVATRDNTLYALTDA